MSLYRKVMNDKLQEAAEIWYDMVGFEGYIQISNLERVKSVEREYVLSNQFTSYTRLKKSKIITKRINKQGYETINFGVKGVLYTRFIHRELAKIFIPNPENKPHVNHINGIRLDNRIENLEWCTPMENIQNALDRNAMVKREKPVIQMSKQGVKINEFKSALEASKETNVDSGSISSCCNGKVKTAGGYIWVFKHDKSYCNYIKY